MYVRAWALPAGHDVRPLELDSAIHLSQTSCILKKKFKKVHLAVL